MGPNSGWGKKLIIAVSYSLFLGFGKLILPKMSGREMTSGAVCWVSLSPP